MRAKVEFSFDSQDRELSMQTMKVDIVLPWVDFTNPEWMERYSQYAPLADGDTQKIRFRDWGLLRYWFRGIEKFAPWVNNIYFITSGETPEWLNLDHPQLKWIKHEDYIPHEYLPTFSANTIELNLHRIKDLSERFVYFNDDVFLLRETKPTVFFKKNLPCDYGVMSAKSPVHIAINGLQIIEKAFDKHAVMKKNLRKWFSPKYGIKVMNNILLYPWKEFSGFVDPHVALPFLKSSFEKVWDFSPKTLDATCRRKFRTSDDVNQWVVRYWQLAEGMFYPRNVVKTSISMIISDDDLNQINDIITNQRYQCVCFNDSETIDSFEDMRQSIENSFIKILPEQSAFERSI